MRRRSERPLVAVDPVLALLVESADDLPPVVGDAPGPAPQAEMAPAAFTNAPALPVSNAAQAAEMDGRTRAITSRKGRR